MARISPVWLISLGALFLLPSLALASPNVPAPQISKGRMFVRQIKSKMSVSKMRGRLESAALPSGIKQMFMKNLDRIEKNGSSFGTFKLDKFSCGAYRYKTINSIGAKTSRTMEWMKARHGSNNKKLTSFSLIRAKIDGKERKVSAIILTPKVALISYGLDKQRVIEHENGKVIKVLPVKISTDRSKGYIASATEKLEQGGQTLEQVFKSHLIKIKQPERYTLEQLLK